MDADKGILSTSTSHEPLPIHNAKKVTKGIRAEGESGRSGFHTLKFLKICFRSSCTLSMVVNILWPFVPAALALVRPSSVLRLECNITELTICI